jgi:hypothetical protein
LIADGQRFLPFQFADCAGEEEAISPLRNPQSAFCNPQLEGSILPLAEALFNRMKAAARAALPIRHGLPAVQPAES